jgi:SAM domain (Sterile alpha motif)
MLFFTLTEQEITGDVLLELDVNLLKSEIGIMAFGKRMRIANAITDLRRPPSIIYSDPPDLSQTSPMMHTSSPLSQSYTHSRNQSQQSHSYTGTLQSSLGQGPGTNGYITESPAQEYPSSERSATINEQQYQQQQPTGVGLGIAFALPAGASAPNILGGKAAVS